MFLIHKRLQTEGGVMNVLHDVALGYEEFQFAGLRLAGFKDLLKQIDHTLDVHLHEIIFLVVFWDFFT